MSAGRYHFGGWSVVGGQGPSRLASVHEAWHDRLQFTTMYGLLVQHLWAVGEANDDASWTSRGDDLLLGTRRTHEEYAALMTELMAGDLLRSLRDEYETYARFADSARRRTGPADDYAMLHRVSGMYRACMQPAGLPVGQGGLGSVSAASIGRAQRPDHRLAVLTAQLDRYGWPAGLTHDAGEDVAGMSSEGSPRLQTIEDYRDEPEDVWEVLNGAYYDWCRDLLEEAGCPTLSYNGQREWLRELHGAASAAASRPLRLVAAFASGEEAEDDADVAMRAFEGETLSFAPLAPWTFVDPQAVGAEEFVSGRGDGRHVFVAIRPRGRLAWRPDVSEAGNGSLPGDATDAPSSFEGPAASSGGSVALLRTSRTTADGRVVFVRPVTVQEIERLTGAGVRVMVSVSMMSLSDPGVRDMWGRFFGAKQCTTLVDLSLAGHVVSWAAEPRITLVYGIGEYQVNGQRAVCLGVVADTAARPDPDQSAESAEAGRAVGAVSRLYFAVVSPAFAAAFTVWATDHRHLRDTLVRDDTILDRHEEVLTPTMGHLLVEEPFFDLKAGATHG